MSPSPTSRRPLVPPAGAQAAPAAHATTQRPAHPDAPPRVQDSSRQREPLSWGKVIGFGVGGGLVVAGLAAAGMNLLG
ncbi:hypothetical protein [Cellulosimicrobium sp. Marseille-Q4280]|uniref:hypothetical protein n=1 Tax=Cellulosimicrobium sp. Marseille-Q4280 TaxID=2937992 RepID=UPI00203EAE72|nr:hypothetical protein [Cellulosimicrobium sp. Marseille-Q4280]